MLQEIYHPIGHSISRGLFIVRVVGICGPTRDNICSPARENAKFFAKRKHDVH